MSQELEPNRDLPIFNAFGSVRVMAFDAAGTVLLLKRAEGQQTGLWELPGGKQDHPEESPLDTAKREFEEEVGRNVLLCFPDEKVHELPSRTFEHKGILRTIFPKVVVGVTNSAIPVLDSSEHDLAMRLYPNQITPSSNKFTVDALAAASFWVKETSQYSKYKKAPPKRDF